MNREEVTKELDEFKEILEEYKQELKEQEKRSTELEREKKLQEEQNEKYILIDKEKVNINKVMRIKQEITSLEEYRDIYIKAMDKKVNEKAIRVIREYNDKARAYINSITTGNREALEELKEKYKRDREALESNSRKKEQEEKAIVLYPREEAIKYLDEEQLKEAKLIRTQI